MLINVFGIWLMAANIAILKPDDLDDNDCNVYFVSGAGYGRSHIHHEFKNQPCDQVAAEINRQLQPTNKTE